MGTRYNQNIRMIHLIDIQADLPELKPLQLLNENFSMFTGAPDRIISCFGFCTDALTLDYLVATDGVMVHHYNWKSVDGFKLMDPVRFRNTVGSLISSLVIGLATEALLARRQIQSGNTTLPSSVVYDLSGIRPDVLELLGVTV